MAIPLRTRPLAALPSTGPGIWLEDLLWEIKPAPPIGVCNLGPDGDVDVQISTSGSQARTLTGEAGLLGFFVTTPGASIPLGPGQVVQNGTTYWALSTADFPNGFYGPFPTVLSLATPLTLAKTMMAWRVAFPYQKATVSPFMSSQMVLNWNLHTHFRNCDFPAVTQP